MLGDANWDALEQLFRTLDVWRHLPKYQLERRTDIFFTPYLPTLLAARFGKPICTVVVPEFPLKQAVHNSSNNVDYALFAQDHSEVFFVELKTDMSSRNDEQDAYLAEAQRVRFRQILLNLREIFCGTPAKEKYLHLLHLLQAAGQIKLRDNLTAALYPQRQRGIRYGEDSFEVLAAAAPIHVVYVQPQPSPACDVIDFAEFSRHVAQFGDPFSQLFAKYLLRWQHPSAAFPPEPCT